MSAVSPTPEGFHSLTPYIVVKNAASALDFYQKAFDAVELYRFTMPFPGDLIGHSRLRIGDSVLLLSDEMPAEWGCPPDIFSPTTGKGTTMTLQLYVPDVDAMYQQALDAGCESVMEPEDTFWGDRYCQVRDPFGHHWALATHIKDMSVAEIAAAAAQEFSNYTPAPADD